MTSLVERLIELDLDARTLREDPRGETWLPADLRARIATDPACAREFDEFIATELELFDMRQPSDAFFTKQVMQRLPPTLGSAVDDQRRTWILASAYALAIGLAYVLLGPLLGSGEVSDWFGSVRSWSENHVTEASGAGLAIALLVVMAAAMLVPLGGRDRAIDA